MRPISRSSDERWQLEVDEWEARPSQWVQTPQLRDLHRQELLLRFKDPAWSLDDARWETPDQLHLQIRHFPGDHHPYVLDVAIDLTRLQATVGKQQIPLAQLEACAASYLSIRQPR